MGKLLGGQSFWPIWEGEMGRVEDMARREVVLCRVRVRVPVAAAMKWV